MGGVEQVGIIQPNTVFYTKQKILCNRAEQQKYPGGKTNKEISAKQRVFQLFMETHGITTSPFKAFTAKI